MVELCAAYRQCLNRVLPVSLTADSGRNVCCLSVPLRDGSSRNVSWLFAWQLTVVETSAACSLKTAERG